MRRWAWMWLCAAATAHADPLDAMEGYALRGGPPRLPSVGEMLGIWAGEFMFAAIAVGLGVWMLKSPGRWARMEAALFGWWLAAQGGVRWAAHLAAALLAVVWIFIAQWLFEHGWHLPPMAMLAVLSLEIVRALSGQIGRA
ncbi:MAG: hypothetical protein D6771_04955 [Zetaproteobacteria bacterium]|nr:MAG: hypothetical protein D6771_04955 [Zetaproteobacteria bacterium]